MKTGIPHLPNCFAAKSLIIPEIPLVKVTYQFKIIDPYKVNKINIF